jgi:ABC-type branched-subunit amino acid transport system substrate-binding protein
MIIRFVLIFTILMTPLSTLQAAEVVSIGVVLPLSGKFASFGNKALQGAELAMERYNSTEAGKKRPVRLLIKDSRGMPKMAEKAVTELNMDDVDVIIGPILATTADAAAKKAQELKIPIITMTQKEGITGIGGWVFRNGMTNAAQVKGLVDYASRRGVKKVAIIYPDNPFGRELTVVFTTEMAKVGGEVVASKDYKEGQTDFGLEIKALVGQEFLEKMKVYTEEREKEFKEAEKSKAKPTLTSETEPVEEMERPTPDFDAVFIPDYADRVGLIVPQLAFYDVRDVKLLGISGWNSPKLINLAGAFLSDDVIIVDGFFSGSPRPQVIDFVGAYRETFGKEPGIVEALAYDTMGIVLSVIPEGGDSRDGIKKTILKIKDYQGVSGNITFSGSDVERSFYYLTVMRGVIEEVTDH